MTDQATRVVPAGWYEDPSDGSQVRWWNGIAWTDHTQVKPDLDADADADAQTAELEDRFNTPAAPATRPRGRVLSTSTSSSWLIAFSPLLFVAAAVAVFALELYTEQTPLRWLVLLVPYALTVLWAFLDVRKLRRWGHTPPTALWSILGPLVYLVVRKVKVSGWGQLAAFAGIILAAAGITAALSSTGAGRPLELAIRIQAEIRDELVSSGAASAVACPPVADTTTVGSLYTCDVTLPNGIHRSLWVSIDSDAGDYSYSFSIE